MKKQVFYFVFPMSGETITKKMNPLEINRNKRNRTNRRYTMSNKEWFILIAFFVAIIIAILG